MDTVDMMISSSMSYYNNLKKDPNGRYRSWEHCYSNFYHAREKDNADVDYLSLQLAFYLASWGMYRGSSFLLQKDYRVHIPIVEELLDKDYDLLMGINCSELKKDTNKKKLIKLNEYICGYYDSIRRKVKEKNLKNDVSYTLITKILMGTMGCVPAYDRYFIAGIKNRKVAIGKYNMKSVLQLVDFYERNESRLESVRENMRVYDLPYPQMKMIDMGFWQIGFDMNNR